MIKKQLKNRFDAEGYDYDLKFDWITQPQDYSALLATQEKQPNIKPHEPNKNNEECKSPSADPQVTEKIARILEEDRNASVEANCTGKSQTLFSKENQDRTGSTAVDKPPAPAPPLKATPAESKEVKNPEKERKGKKCGCSIF